MATCDIGAFEASPGWYASHRTSRRTLTSVRTSRYGRTTTTGCRASCLSAAGATSQAARMRCAVSCASICRAYPSRAAECRPRTHGAQLQSRKSGVGLSRRGAPVAAAGHPESAVGGGERLRGRTGERPGRGRSIPTSLRSRLGCGRGQPGPSRRQQHHPAAVRGRCYCRGATFNQGTTLPGSVIRWNVTWLVQGWLNGTIPNIGIALMTRRRTGCSEACCSARGKPPSTTWPGGSLDRGSSCASKVEIPTVTGAWTVRTSRRS